MSGDGKRLFSSAKQPAPAAPAVRVGSLAEVELPPELAELLRATGDRDPKAKAFGDKLSARGGGGAAISTPTYETVPAPAGSLWKIEFTRDADEIVIQMIPLREALVPWQAVIPQMIGVIDPAVPRSVEVKYLPPARVMNQVTLNIYTIRLSGLVVLPGWEGVLRGKVLPGLYAVNAWKQA